MCALVTGVQTCALPISFDAPELRPAVSTLAGIADTLLMAYPNAGLPNDLGQYDEESDTTAGFIREWAEEGLINVIGGCCGTTPEPIHAMAKAVRGMPQRAIPTPPPVTRLSGLEPITQAAWNPFSCHSAQGGGPT